MRGGCAQGPRWDSLFYPSVRHGATEWEISVLGSCRARHESYNTIEPLPCLDGYFMVKDSVEASYCMGMNRAAHSPKPAQTPTNLGISS